MLAKKKKKKKKKKKAIIKTHHLSKNPKEKKTKHVEVAEIHSKNILLELNNFCNISVINFCRLSLTVPWL